MFVVVLVGSASLTKFIVSNETFWESSSFIGNISDIVLKMFKVQLTKKHSYGLYAVDFTVRRTNVIDRFAVKRKKLDRVSINLLVSHLVIFSLSSSVYVVQYDHI